MSLLTLQNILIAIASLFGLGFFWQRNKTKNAESLITDLSDKTTIAENNGNIQSEKDQIKNVSQEVLDGKALEDFFNIDSSK